MTKSHYLTEFKKHLSGLSKPDRLEIISELEANLESFNDTDKDLEEHFGQPAVLADSYKANYELKKPMLSKIGKATKTSLMTFGSIFIVLILIMGLSAYYFTRDEFDHSNIAEAKDYIKQESFHPIPINATVSPLNISFKRGVLLTYHTDNVINQMHCKGKDDQNYVLFATEFELSFCILFLTKDQTIDIASEQALIKLIRPQADVTISAYMGGVEIDQGDNLYQFNITSTEAEIKGIDKNPPLQPIAAITLDVKMGLIEAYR